MLFRRQRGLSCFAFLAALLCISPAFAQRAAISGSRTERNPKKPAIEATEQQPPAGEQPRALGEPSKNEIQILIDGMKAELNNSIERLVPVKHADGTVSVNVEGRFQNVTIARIEPDGSISESCVITKDEARNFLQHGAGGKKAAAAAPISVPKPKAVLEEK